MRAVAGPREEPLLLTYIDPRHDPRWDQFVRDCRHASVYHLGAWAGIISATYRFRVRYLALEDSRANLRAVMPLLYKRGPVSGARLRSLPVVPFAGPLAETPALEREIVTAACREVRPGEQLVITTSSDALSGLPGLAQRAGLPRWVVPLGEGADPARWHAGNRNPARGVRRSQAAGVTVREARSEADLRTFYQLYLRTQRRLRAVPRSLRQLTMERSEFGPAGVFRLFMAESRGTPVAAAVWHVFAGTVEGLYYGGDERRLDLRGNHALYAHVLDWALDHGCTELDLGGAAPGSSLAYFKRQWGAVPVPLHFYVYPAEAAPSDPAAPPAPAPAEVGERRWLERIWSVTPLPLIRLAGTVVYRYL
jgi:hypothetical protein